MSTNSNDDMFDNKFFMDYEDALSFVKTFFENELSWFQLIKEYKQGAYWSLEFHSENIKISIECGRGFLDHKIIRDSEDYSLVDLDNNINNLEAASKKNIVYLLNVIKKFMQLP